MAAQCFRKKGGLVGWAAWHCRQKTAFSSQQPIIGIVRNNKKTVICISLLVLAVDLLFLSINYFYLQKNLYASLFQQAKTHQEEFKLNLKMAYSSMLQMTTLIGSNSEFSQCLMKERKSGSGNARRSYQFGSIEDRPDVQLQPKSGPTYSWMRGISPVWAVDPQTNKRVYVGSLEVSTSFKQIVPLYAKLFQVEAAVLFSKAYVKSKMWDEYTKKYFERLPKATHYPEVASASIADVKRILAKIRVADSNYATDRVQLICENSIYYSVYYFPLLDYQKTKTDEVYLETVGFFLLWHDVSDEVNRFKSNFQVNAVLALLGFLLMEGGLLWIFNWETRLSVAEQSAAVDELTGLFNRRYLDDLLEDELNRAARAGISLPLSLIICDVDFFKRFNDTYGHKAGDECLQRIADTLRLQAKRSSDCVARYGGEEFVIVLPRTDLSSAVEIAEAARRAVLSLNIPHSSSDVHRFVTVTLGVACTCNIAERDSLFEVADRNLYAAKNSGRNKVEPSKPLPISRPAS